MTTRIGDTSTLLFLHAFGASRRSWNGVVAELADDRPTVALDLPGFGDNRQSGVQSVEAYADWIAAEVDRLAVSGKPVVLVGHSMSGKFALAFAARRPASLAGLVLIGPSPPTLEPIESEERRRQIDGFGDIALARRSIKSLLVDHADHAVLDEAVEDRLKVDRAAWLFWLEHGSREDISAGMNNIDVPALIISGDDDRAISAEVVAREVAGRLPGATFTLQPDAGHLIPLEQPARVAALIQGWLDDRRA